VRLSNGERRTLAELGQKLGRQALAEVATIVKPETILAWHRRDSDMLIDHLRGYEPARQRLKRFEAREMQGYLSIIAVAELAAGQMRQAQEAQRRHPFRFYPGIELQGCRLCRKGKVEFFDPTGTLTWRSRSCPTRPNAQHLHAPEFKGSRIRGRDGMPGSMLSMMVYVHCSYGNPNTYRPRSVLSHP
jgi:hypothetical protein